MNQSTLKYLNFLILIFAFQGYCQNQANDYETDYIKDLNGIRLNCKVVKIKNGRLTYRLYKKSQPFKLNLMNLTDLYISNNNFIDSPIGTEIKEPKDGFSHIYIYCAMLPTAQIFYNGEKLIKIKKGTYFLHKVRANEQHTYYTKLNLDEEKLRITPESGEVIFIHPVYNEDVMGMEMGNTMMVRNGIKLKMDKSKISKYAVLSMGKKL